jgi:hypothetical protein
MAARKKAKVETAPDPREMSFDESGDRARVQVVPIADAADFVTIGAGSPIFARAINPSGVPQLAGKFIRIDPPPDASDEYIEVIRKALLTGGALAVRVMPRPRKLVTPGVATERRERAGARDVVLRMVEESNSRDREKLRATVETVMGKAGI